MISRVLVLLLVLTAALETTRSHDGRFYDELLWTKSNWNEYVLGFPYDDVLAKLGPSTREFLGAIVDVEALKDMSQKAAVDFEVRIEGLESNSVMLRMSSSKEAVSRLLGCDMQTALAEVLWPVLSNWTMVHLQPLEDRHLRKLVDDACRIDVPVLALKDTLLMWVTIQREARGASQNSGGGAIRVTTLSPYIVSLPRHSQHAGPGEISAVVSACKDAADAAWQQSVLGAQKMYLEVVRQAIAPNAVPGKDEKGGSDEKGAKGAKVAKRDDRIEIDRSCCDYHPQCQFWADKGECEANPKYMVGNEETGQCRRACGSCEVPETGAIPTHLTASNAQMVEDAYTETLMFLMDGADRCGRGTDEATTELDSLLRSHASSHARSIADQMRGAASVLDDVGGAADSSDKMETSDKTAAGTTKGAQTQGDDTSIVKVEPTIKVTTFADASIRLKPEDITRAAELTLPNEFEDGVYHDIHDDDFLLEFAEIVKAELYDILHDRCVHVETASYWTHQFCYGASLIRFHEDETSLTTIPLGQFEEREDSWTVTGEGADRAVVHDYSKGAAPCFEGDDPDPKPRKTTVRYLCDDSLSRLGAGIRAELNQPATCEVELVVFLGELCYIFDDMENWVFS